MKTLARLLLATSLAVSASCAKTDWIDRTLVTVDVTRSWYGRVGGIGSAGRELLFDLEQQGSTVKGVLLSGTVGGSLAGPLGGPIDGTVAGDVFRFKDSRGCIEGELTVSGDEMDGRASTFAGSRPLFLRRGDPSSPPASPPR